MKKIFLILFFLIGNVAISKAQMGHFNDGIFSPNWDIIAKISFDEKSHSEIYPIYPKDVKTYNGKEFELEGYIIPIQKGTTHDRFMLSSLPLNQCYYCGKDGIPIMVLVEMQKGVKYTLKPIKIKGKLILENKNILDGYPVVLKTAKHIQK